MRGNRIDGSICLTRRAEAFFFSGTQGLSLFSFAMGDGRREERETRDGIRLFGVDLCDVDNCLLAVQLLDEYKWEKREAGD